MNKEGGGMLRNEISGVTPQEVKKSMTERFRNSVAPLWYLWGTRFADPELNRHCRESLRKERTP